MKSTFAVLFLVGTLWAAQETSSQVTAKPWENLLGSWKELPGPDTPALIKAEPEGDHIKFSLGCKQENSCPDVIVAAYDGKQYKDTGNANWQVSYEKKGERTLQEEGYLKGRLSSTTTWRISSDGNTLTRTSHSVNPQGSKDRIFVHERSGGP